MSTQELTYEEWKNRVAGIFIEEYNYHTWLDDYDPSYTIDCWEDGDSPEDYVDMEVSYWHD